MTNGGNNTAFNGTLILKPHLKHTNHSNSNPTEATPSSQDEERAKVETSKLPILTQPEIDQANSLLAGITARHPLRNFPIVEDRYRLIAISIAKKAKKPGYEEALAYLQGRVDTYEEFLVEQGYSID